MDTAKLLDSVIGFETGNGIRSNSVKSKWFASEVGILTLHQRKIKSYQVETHWYKEWNDQCYGFSRTAKFLGAYAKRMSNGSYSKILMQNFLLGNSN